MDKFLCELERHRKVLEEIGDKIENKEPYMDSVKEYLPSLNEMTTAVLELVQNPQIALELNLQFYMQVLNDIVYGVENEDSVFLLDVFRYGLLEIYNYIETELQGRECYE
ncbi:MAG: hypothetical protein MSA09_00595 [Lachnospiraceae bacterium]|nr:hypothetical protein [Lachnospiraceae bacterium]